MSENDELIELVKRLLTNYVTFHRIRRVDCVGFRLATDQDVDVTHFVSSDLAHILTQMRETIDKESNL